LKNQYINGPFTFKIYYHKPHNTDTRINMQACPLSIIALKQQILDLEQDIVEEKTDLIAEEKRRFAAHASPALTELEKIDSKKKIKRLYSAKTRATLLRHVVIVQYDGQWSLCYTLMSRKERFFIRDMLRDMNSIVDVLPYTLEWESSITKDRIHMVGKKRVDKGSIYMYIIGDPLVFLGG
jgi:hypothetical protein